MKLRFVWLMVAEVSKTEGRVGQTTNMVIGGTVTDDSTNEWVSLDKKVFIFIHYVFVLFDFSKFVFFFVLCSFFWFSLPV
jgi:hypothetical protein